MISRRDLAAACFTAGIALLMCPSSFAGPMEELDVRDINLRPTLEWYERPNASGRVTILGMGDDGAAEDMSSNLAFLEILVQNLRCRGPVFSLNESNKEPFRNYELQINDFAIFSFNPECAYNPGVGGTYSTKILIEESLLPFDISDFLTFKIVLQPDDVVALVGEDDF